MSAIASAVEQLIVAQANPDRAITQQGMVAFVDQMKSQTQSIQLETIEKASKMLAQAIENNAPQSVLDAYERILSKASA